MPPSEQGPLDERQGLAEYSRGGSKLSTEVLADAIRLLGPVPASGLTLADRASVSGQRATLGMFREFVALKSSKVAQ